MSEDAETYRGRAHHARLAAKATFDKQQRAIFERLAQSYEAMAREAEQSADATPLPMRAASR